MTKPYLPRPAALGIIGVLALVLIFGAARAADGDRLPFAAAAMLLAAFALLVLRFGRASS